METDYRLIAESAEDIIFTVDRTFNVTYINTHGAGMLGGSPEMVVGQNLSDLFPPETAKRQKASVKKVFDTGKPLSMDALFTFKDHDVWLSTRLIPIHDSEGSISAVMGISRDITELKEKEAALEKNEKVLQERLKHTAILSELGSALINSVESEDLLQKMTSGIGRGLDMDRVLIYRVDFDEHVVDGLAEWLNPKTPDVKSTKNRYDLDLFLNGALYGWKEKKLLISHYNEVNPILVGDGSSELLHGRMGIKSLLWYPFDFGEHGFDALVLNQTRGRRDWTDEELSLIKRIVTQVAIAMEKIKFLKERDKTDSDLRENLGQLRALLEDTVNALAVTAEKKDPYTAGHQQRVVKLAVAIAKELGLSEEKTEGIRISAIVHDIGKIYIPAEILSKPGTLNDLEFGMVQTHSQFGFDILKTVDFPWPVAKAVLQHHERLDGSGYPLKLKGDEICLEARILAVADVAESMLSHRPYREKRSLDEVIAELEETKGSQLDEQAVDAAVKLLKSKTLNLV